MPTCRINLHRHTPNLHLRNKLRLQTNLYCSPRHAVELNLPSTVSPHLHATTFTCQPDCTLHATSCLAIKPYRHPASAAATIQHKLCLSDTALEFGSCTTRHHSQFCSCKDTSNMLVSYVLATRLDGQQCRSKELIR